MDISKAPNSLTAGQIRINHLKADSAINARWLEEPAATDTLTATINREMEATENKVAWKYFQEMLANDAKKATRLNEGYNAAEKELGLANQKIKELEKALEEARSQLEEKADGEKEIEQGTEEMESEKALIVKSEFEAGDKNAILRQTAYIEKQELKMAVDNAAHSRETASLRNEISILRQQLDVSATQLRWTRAVNYNQAWQATLTISWIKSWVNAAMTYAQTYETTEKFPKFVAASLDEYASAAVHELNRSCSVGMEQEVSLLDPDVDLPVTFHQNEEFIELLQIAPAFSHVGYSKTASSHLYSLEGLSDLKLRKHIKSLKEMCRNLDENSQLLELPDFVWAPKSEFNSAFAEISKAFEDIGLPPTHIESLQKVSIQAYRKAYRHLIKDPIGIKPQKGAWLTLLTMVIAHQTQASIWDYNAKEIAASILEAADVDLTLEGSLQPATKAIIVKLLSKFAKAAYSLDFYTQFLESNTKEWEKADTEKLLALIPTAIIIGQIANENFDFTRQPVNCLDIVKAAYIHAKFASTIDGAENELEAWEVAFAQGLSYTPDNLQGLTIASRDIIALAREVSCEQILACTGHDWKTSKGKAGEGTDSQG